MLSSVLVLGTIGLFVGVCLSFASKYFYVAKDEKVIAVTEMLSGANCGACGYAGCSALAKAICLGEAPVNLCVALKKHEVDKISKMLGYESNATIDKKAYIKCAGGNNCKDRYEYFGPSDCSLMSQYDGGIKLCTYGCVGGGSCVKVCPFNAIHINENKMAEIDYEKCTGCSLCVSECPRNLIVLEDVNKVFVECNSCEKGAVVIKFCTTGCIGCKLCEKECGYNAIHINNFLATIDYLKCVNCEKCVNVCPNKTIKIFKNNIMLNKAM